MVKRNRQQVSDTKREKMPTRRANQKYVSVHESGLAQFKPSKAQQEMLQVVRNNTITFVEGPAGSGKTAGILWAYCQEYLKDNSKSIYVVRTPMEAGGLDRIGFLPDDLSAKIAPHFESTKEIISGLIGKGKLECDIDKRIFFKIPNFMVGATLDRALLLIDEAQLLQPMIMKLILERTGIDTKVVVAGDTTQIYANNKEAHLRNGMSDAISRFIQRNGTPRFNNIGYYRFSVEDIQRSDIVKTVVRAYNTEGK